MIEKVKGNKGLAILIVILITVLGLVCYTVKMLSVPDLSARAEIRTGELEGILWDFDGYYGYVEATQEEITEKSIEKFCLTFVQESLKDDDELTFVIKCTNNEKKSVWIDKDNAYTGITIVMEKGGYRLRGMSDSSQEYSIRQDRIVLMENKE